MTQLTFPRWGFCCLSVFFFKYLHTVDIVCFFPLIIAEATNNMRLGIAIQYFLIAILYLVVHRVVDLRNHWYW